MRQTIYMDNSSLVCSFKQLLMPGEHQKSVTDNPIKDFVESNAVLQQGEYRQVVVLVHEIDDNNHV